jgi:hypothetical protein
LGRVLRLAAPLLAALALAAGPAALAGGPSMSVGAADDIVEQPTLAAATTEMGLARLAGLDSVRVTALWSRGLRAPPAELVASLGNTAAAAALYDVRVFVSVYPFGSSQTPLSDSDRADFAAFAVAVARAVPEIRDFIVGNEPNLNRFWLPQFDSAGEDVAAPAYEQLLAQTYDALKAFDDGILVYGGAVSPRGVDKPNTGRDTHSPTTFIPDMGAAYRASGRTLPIMDAFAFHPYGDNSSQPPDFAHPASSTVALADYGKLVGLLAKAFDGTAQPGSQLPILYDEYGVETTIPPEKAALYTGTEIAATKPVDETTQGRYYAQALALAFCQPNVMGLLIFDFQDETALDRFQSGVYYADGTPKSDVAALAAAARQTRGGVIAQCPGMTLTPRATMFYPTGAELRRPRLAIELECTIDCDYVARVERLPDLHEVASQQGTAVAGFPTPVVFDVGTLPPGRYRFRATLTAPLNPGPNGGVRSPPFAVPAPGAVLPTGPPELRPDRPDSVPSSP